MAEYPPKSPFTTPLELSLVEMVHERCETWKNTLSAIIEYFQIIIDLERAKEKSFRKAAALLGPSNVFGSPLEESSAVSPAPSTASSTPPAPFVSNNGATWLVPLQALALKGNGESESIVRFMERATVPDLQQLRESIRMGSRQLKEQLVAILAPLHKSYEALNSAMGAHQSIWLELLRAKDPRSEDGTDPWLQELKLSLRVQSFLTEKHAFAQALESVHTAQRALDSTWSSTLKTIVAEFFTVYSKSTIQFGEQMQDIAALMQEVQPEHEWASALHNFRLDFGWSLETPPFDGFMTSVISQINHSIIRQSDANQEVIKRFSIAKSGFLMKQSSGSFGSKSWSTLFWILTGSGFLHGYSFKEKHNAVVAVNIPKPAQVIHIKTLQEVNTEAAKVLLESNVVPDASLADPSVTIWLGGGTVAPVIASEGNRVDSSGCIFCVVSGALSSGGFLFGGKGEKKYFLQSFVEEDMVDWCIAIKQVISSCQEDILPKPSTIMTAQEYIKPTPAHEYESDNQQQQYQQQQEEKVEEYFRAPPQDSSVSRMLPPELEKNPWED